MKKVLLVLVLVVGCASPAKDYVLAEKAAWDQYDPYLDGWVDASTLSPEHKDALHQLNVARRARVAHAVADVQSAK